MDIAELRAELRRLLDSYEYAWAMGASSHGGRDHPRLAAVRRRVADLRALIAEHQKS